MPQSETHITQLKLEWSRKLKPLVGRSIVEVRYLDASERAAMSIHHSGVVLQLDDGTLLWPMMDDEGNDAGALFIQKGRAHINLPDRAPVI